MSASVDVREAFSCPPAVPLVPGRLRAPLHHVVDGVMTDTWTADVGRWLQEHRARFVRGGDPEGVHRFAHDLPDFDEHVTVYHTPAGELSQVTWGSRLGRLRPRGTVRVRSEVFRRARPLRVCRRRALRWPP